MVDAKMSNLWSVPALFQKAKSHFSFCNLTQGVNSVKRLLTVVMLF